MYLPTALHRHGTLDEPLQKKPPSTKYGAVAWHNIVYWNPSRFAGDGLTAKISALSQVLDTYIPLRSWTLKPSSLVQGDNWRCIGAAPSLSTDRILADETGIHLLSFSLKQGLEDESFWLFISWVGERRFSHSRGKVVEYHNITMPRARRWQRGKGRKIHGQESKCNGLDAL